MSKRGDGVDEVRATSVQAAASVEAASSDRIAWPRSCKAETLKRLSWLQDEPVDELQLALAYP